MVDGRRHEPAGITGPLVGAVAALLVAIASAVVIPELDEKGRPSPMAGPGPMIDPITIDGPLAGREEIARVAGVEGRTAPTIVAHARTDDVVARAAPTEQAGVVAELANPTDRGGPLVFRAVGPPLDGWLEVQLPVRPNGTTGWIPLDDVELSVNPYRVEVDADAHRLTIYHHGRVKLSTAVAIGTGDTPTPLGEFYLVELLRPRDPNGIYGSYAYGLSGYSDTLQSFNGGNGVIGIHGTNRPDLLGQDVSHGCIRVANPTIEGMARFLPLGTPVSIERSERAAAGPAVGNDRA